MPLFTDGVAKEGLPKFNPRPGRELNPGPPGWQSEILPTVPTSHSTVVERGGRVVRVRLGRKLDCGKASEDVLCCFAKPVKCNHVARLVNGSIKCYQLLSIKYSRQLCSSDLSSQSADRSHLQVIGIHFLLVLHLNIP